MDLLNTEKLHTYNYHIKHKLKATPLKTSVIFAMLSFLA